jgi:hypothetical protein
MAITYNNTVKDARLTVVRDAIDAAVGAGYLELGTAGFAQTLATVTFSVVSGTVAAQALTFSDMPKSDTNTSAGTPVEARIKDGDGNIVVSGLTVGTAGTDIILDTADLQAAGTVTINSAVINHA